MTKKKAKKQPAKNNWRKPKPTPRERRLPGMEDAAIEEIENKARDLKDIRNEIAQMRDSERNALDGLIQTMKTLGRSSYHHEGIHIDIRDLVRAKVKVKTEKPEDELAAD